MNEHDEQEDVNLEELLPGVPLSFLPSKWQWRFWGPFIDPGQGTDPDGAFLGWCPIHDTTRDRERMSAVFNFAKGIMRCEGDPSCHQGKRAVSLSNVAIKMIRRGE